MNTGPKEARGAVILGLAALFRAARMIAGTPCSAGEAMNEAETLVGEAEARKHVEFEKS